jgi:Glycine zipper 2TM domain
MNKKLITLGATAAVLMSAIAPTTAALAHGHGRGHGHGYGHYQNNGGYYQRSDYDNGYNNRGYDNGYYQQSRYEDDDRGYRNNNSYRCDRGKGSTGLIVGAVAGGLLGRAVVGRYGDRTAGTIAGAGVGALAGRALQKAGNNRC